MTTSTAEALPAPTPVIERPSELHARRRSEVVWWLRSTIRAEEAEGMASAGYRPLPCGGCGRMTCLACKEEPAETVQASRGGKRSSADPRFVRVLVARLGQFDPMLVKHAAGAVRALPAPERLTLILELGCGLSQAEVAAQIGVSRASVQRLKDRALDAVVRAVWR